MNPVVQHLKSYVGKPTRAEDPPFTRWLQGVLLEVEEGELAMMFVVREEMANPVGYLHGGVQNAVIDDVIGFAAMTLGGESFYVSLNLHVDYLGKARVGDRFVARARIHRHGNRIVNAQCELSDLRGRVLSRGTSNLMKSAIPVLPEITGALRRGRSGGRSRTNGEAPSALAG